MASKANGVLVIATGGNVCLCAGVDAGSHVLKQAPLATIQKLVAVGEDHDTMTFREKGIIPVDVRVHFADVRKTESEFADPELLDSAQVDPRLWSELATLINKSYPSYEGFVVLHGLDTMAYTASALSVMLGDLDKPIVVTGSQRPLNYNRTDAIQNITTAITFAAARSLHVEPLIREVTVYSHDALFRGNRVSMVSASSYRSFDSPNYGAVAGVGVSIEVQPHLVRRHKGGMRPNLRNDTSAKVHILDVFPGMDPEILRGIRASNERLANQNVEGEASLDANGDEDAASIRPVAGILLRTYGMGTAPTQERFLHALEELVESGVVIVNVTQARSGRVSHGIDPIHLRLYEHGVVSGVDMTSEAAYAKLVVLLSEGREPEEVADLVQVDHAGEQSQSIFTFHFGAGCTKKDVDGIRKPTAILEPARPMTERHLLKRETTEIRFIQLRLLGLELDPPPREPISRVVKFDAMLVDKDLTIPLIIDESKREHTLTWDEHGRRTINVAFDITGSHDDLLSAGTMLRIDTNEPVRWKRLQVVVYAEVGD